VIGFEPVPQMNLVPIGTNEFFPQLVRLVANEKHRQSHPVQPPEIGRRKQSGAPTELFLSFTPRSFATGIRDADRRALREPRPCSLGRRNVSGDFATAGIPPQDQESPKPGRHHDQEIAGDDGLGMIGRTSSSSAKRSSDGLVAPVREANRRALCVEKHRLAFGKNRSMGCQDGTGSVWLKVFSACRIGFLGFPSIRKPNK
jgi:hypothetical protein